MRLIQCQCTPALSPRPPGEGETFARALVIRPSLVVVRLRNERQRSGDCNHNVRIFQRRASALPLLGERAGVRGNEANSNLRRTTIPGTVKLRESPGGAGGFVRLRWCLVEAVQVRFCAVKNRAVLNRNCVVETRGGEQRNENGQSVTPFVDKDEQSELDSVGGDGRACERCAKPVAEGKTLWHPQSGLEQSPATCGHSTDGWRRNGWKTRHSNQGDRLGRNGVHASRRPKSRPRRSQSTHSSEETSNDRGAKGVQEDGRKLDPTTDYKPLRVPARAVPQKSQPSTYDLGDTVERKAALETARRARSLSQRPHRPESRMREIRPSGSEGGVAPTRHPYPYPARRAGQFANGLSGSFDHN